MADITGTKIEWTFRLVAAPGHPVCEVPLQRSCVSLPELTPELWEGSREKVVQLVAMQFTEALCKALLGEERVVYIRCRPLDVPEG